MSSSPPEPKDPQGPSPAKDITQVSQTAPSPGEQEKELAKNSTPQAAAQAPAATTNSQAPVSTAPISEKPPLDSTPDPEEVQDLPTTARADSGLREPDAKERWRKKRELIIHTRLARFFTWLLLLGFVIFPGTFSKAGTDPNAPGLFNDFTNLPLFPVGCVCCLVNFGAIGYLWYLRSDEPDWLLTNLFSAGLINAFSGLVTTFVNVHAVHSGHYSAPSIATLALASTCTIAYGVLAVVYTRKRRERARYRRSAASRGSTA